MSAAVWDEAGQPLNVEAAIADAIEWLLYLRKLPAVRRDADQCEALAASVACLAAYGDAETQAAHPPISAVETSGAA
jgi:hypothetical protein